MKRILLPLVAISLFFSLAFADSGLQRGGGGTGASGLWPPEGTPADLLDGDQTGGSGASGIVTSTIAAYQATLFHSFQTAGSTKAVITNAGRVGIGTTNPASELEVSGTITGTTIDANIAASKVQAGALGSSVRASSVTAQTLNAANLKSTNNPADTQVPKYDAATGLVTWSADNNSGGGGSGSGTTSSTMVVIQGGTNGNAQNIISLQNQSSTVGYVASTGKFNWGSVSARPVVIGSGPLVGIGTSDPWAPLHVVADTSDLVGNSLLAMFNGGGYSNPKVYIKANSSTSGSSRLSFGTDGFGTSDSVTMMYDYSATGTLFQRFTFGVTNAAQNLLVLRNSDRVGVGISTPAAKVHISTGAGSQGQLLIASTGTQTIFEVNGASVVVNGEMYLNGFKMSTGVVTPASSGVSDPIAIASGSIAHLTSTGSIKAQLVAATSYHLLGTGAGVISGASEIRMDVNSDGTADYIFGTSSVTTTKDVIFGSTFITPIAHYSYVSIASSTYEINFPTHALQGLPLFEYMESSAAYSLHRITLPTLVSGEVPTLKYVDAVSRAASDAGNMVFGLSIATIGAGGFNVDSLVFSSTQIVTLTGTAGAVKSIKSWRTEVPLPGWNTVAGAGNCDAIIRVTPLGGTSTAQRVFHGASIAWKEQK